jgi:hypothetical protein
MAKDFTQHSGIPEVIEKFRVIFGQSQLSGKQVSSWITGDSNIGIACTECIDNRHAWLLGSNNYHRFLCGG